MKEKEIRVTDILLDTGNYRTGKQDDQREAIKALIDEQKNKLVNLAKDIIENGLSPLETVMVYAVPDQKNRYIVVEGNRRVAAIKLATQPDLAADTTWHNAFQACPQTSPRVRCRRKSPARSRPARKTPTLGYSAVTIPD